MDNMDKVYLDMINKSPIPCVLGRLVRKCGQILDLEIEYLNIKIKLKREYIKMGNIYVSQLFSEDKVSELVKDYNIGIEIIEFGIGYTLDKDDNGVVEFCEIMGDLIKRRPLSVHGPFLDLNPASFDSMIKNVTLTRYNQAYNIAKKLGADRIVFHSCYYEDIYFKETYINNSLSLSFYIIPLYPNLNYIFY